jgi:hypothetical protein
MRNSIKMVLAATAAAAMLTGCTAEADTVSENLSKEADSFQVLRRVVFFNGITDTYLLTIEGFCSIVDEGNQLEVTCKVGEDAYTKDFLGLSDNVSYFAEQLDPSNVDPYHHIVIFRPETIVPDIDLQTSGEDK